MYNSFQIFIPDDNKFTLSINLVYYPLLAGFIILFLNLRLEPYHSIINSPYAKKHISNSIMQL